LISNEANQGYIPESLKAKVDAALKNAFSTEALCLAEVQKNGRALQYVPEEFKTEALCFAAVQQDGWALAFVPENLKTVDLCSAAMKHNYYRDSPMKFVPEALQKDVQRKRREN